MILNFGGAAMKRSNWAAAWFLAMGAVSVGTTYSTAQTPLLDEALRRNAVVPNNELAPPEGPLSLLVAPLRDSTVVSQQTLRPNPVGPAARAVSQPVQSSTRDPIFRRSAAEVRMDRLLSRPRAEQAAEAVERELRGFGSVEPLAPTGFDSPDR